MHPLRKIELALGLGAIILLTTVSVRPAPGPAASVIARVPPTATPFRWPTTTPSSPTMFAKELATAGARFASTATAQASITRMPTPTATPAPPAILLQSAPAESDWLVLTETTSDDRRRATVEEHHFPSGDVRQVVAFAEQRQRSEHSDHRVSAFSSDRAQLAYIAQDGLHVRHLESQADRVLIARRPPTAEMRAFDPEFGSWDGPLAGTWTARSPQWSSDSQYLSLSLGYYEGGRVAVVRVADGVAWVNRGFGFGATWARSGARLLTSDSDYGGSSSWLAVFQEPDISAPVYVYGPGPEQQAREWPQALGTPYPARVQTRGAAWAPDAGSIVFIGTPWHEWDASPELALGELTLATGAVRWLGSLAAQEPHDTYLGWPLVDPGGNLTFYQQRVAAGRIDSVRLRNGFARDPLMLPAGVPFVTPVRWITSTQFIAAHAVTAPESGLQLLLIDITTGDLRPITGLLPPYTTVLSVERLPDSAP